MSTSRCERSFKFSSVSQFLLLFPFLFLCFLFSTSLLSTKKNTNSTSLHNAPSFNTNIYPQIIQPSLHHYPFYSPLLSVLNEWNPDLPTPPASFVETLQHFNYSNSSERDLAETYRKAEVPFKVYDVPIFNEVSRTWTKEYLSTNFKNMK